MTAVDNVHVGPHKYTVHVHTSARIQVDILHVHIMYIRMLLKLYKHLDNHSTKYVRQLVCCYICHTHGLKTPMTQLFKIHK